MERRLYDLEELELMTTFQLREICQRERIVKGIINPLDKEELIHTIMQYHGIREQLIIRTEDQAGVDRLKTFLQDVNIRWGTDKNLQIASKIVVHEGLTLSFQDDISIPYSRELDGSNALILNGQDMICGIFYFSSFGNQKEKLYLCKEGEIVCREGSIKNYELYCFGQAESEVLYHIHKGEAGTVPANISAYRIPLIDFEVRSPISLRMPLAIDFGSTNTTAGVFLDTFYFEQAGRAAYLTGMDVNSIQYTTFYEKQTETGDLEEKHILPSVAGILSVKDGTPEYVFGYEAVRLANLSYVDEGFCVFYDIKRWIVDYEKEEEIIDRDGNRLLVERKQIIKAFFEYLIQETRNRFKCRIEKIHISCPVKQKYLFQKLFDDILTDYMMPFEEVLDEGVSVLYNTISHMLESKKLEENYPYHALIVDCGGGTTDLCACTFTIQDKKISYRIEVETGYENGDTDFGGNNLTYRIMQLLKLTLAEALGRENSIPVATILAGLDLDVFRYVDKQGTEGLYQQLEEAYRHAEAFLPTRFQEYENQSRADYYKVKNNYYFLFFLAEQIKKRFYEKVGVLRVMVSSEQEKEERTGYRNPGKNKPGKSEETGVEWIRADKWKLSVMEQAQLQVVKEFPALTFDLFTVDLLLKGDIYGIIRKFMEPLYEEDKLGRFSFLKLTGQSCKIDIFREALKEFIPGRMIQYKRRSNDKRAEAELKMTCVDGALKYMRDKRLGYAEVIIHSGRPVLPYTVTAFTHNGQEVELVNGFYREDITRTISRNLDHVTLQLFLKDMEGRERYSFYYDCLPETFTRVTYEEIEKRHGSHIQQKETDSIENREVKFFVWKRFEEWGYVIVPVYRQEELLHIGKEQFYSFENEGWIQNFFDGRQ